jgi:hypothetical protein
MGPRGTRRGYPRRIALASVVALLLGMLLLVERFQEIPHTAEPASKPAPRIPVAATHARTLPENPPLPQSIAGMLARSADNIGNIEVCGLGRIKVDRGDPSAFAKSLSALGRAAMARWRSALLDSDDSRARAAGLVMQATPAFDGAEGVDGADPASGEQARDSLVQLAAGAADPAVYAMAVNLCNTYADPSPSGACQQISLAEWARIDSDNAVPWLYIAGKARAANDAAAAAAALGRAAQAHRVDSYDSSLLGYARSEMPPDATPTEQYLLSTSMLGYEAAVPMPYYTVATKLCSAETVSDDGARQNCDALAELLVSRATTLLDLVVGASIGSHVGWPSERLRHLSQERNALMQVLMAPMAQDNADPWDCNHVRLGNELLKQIVRLGELGAARDALERSGETIEELAQRQTELMEKIQREAKEFREREELAASTAP